MSKNRHLLLQILAFALRTARLVAPHDQSFEFLAAGTTDKIK
jgi:hypothetical protein